VKPKQVKEEPKKIHWFDIEPERCKERDPYYFKLQNADYVSITCKLKGPERCYCMTEMIPPAFCPRVTR